MQLECQSWISYPVQWIETEDKEHSENGAIHSSIRCGPEFFDTADWLKIRSLNHAYCVMADNTLPHRILNVWLNNITMHLPTYEEVGSQKVIIANTEKISRFCMHFFQIDIHTREGVETFRFKQSAKLYKVGDKNTLRDVSIKLFQVMHAVFQCRIQGRHIKGLEPSRWSPLFPWTVPKLSRFLARGEVGEVAEAVWGTGLKINNKSFSCHLKNISNRDLLIWNKVLRFVQIRALKLGEVYVSDGAISSFKEQSQWRCPPFTLVIPPLVNASFSTGVEARTRPLKVKRSFSPLVRPAIDFSHTLRRPGDRGMIEVVGKVLETALKIFGTLLLAGLAAGLVTILPISGSHMGLGLFIFLIIEACLSAPCYGMLIVDLWQANFDCTHRLERLRSKWVRGHL